MADRPIDATDYGDPLSTLLPSRSYLLVGLVSAGVALGLFLLGYALALVGDLAYLSAPESYLGPFAVFWTLAWLGLADDVYVGVWNDVRPAFAVGDGSYRAVVRPRLERIYDGRRVLGYATVLVGPYALLVAAIYLPGSPFRGDAIDLFLANEPSPHPPGLLRVLLFYLFGAANAVLIAAVVNGFVTHLALVRAVSGLPFRNAHTGAAELKPVARFSVASATVWFAGVTLVVLWVEAGLSGNVGTATIALLVFLGVVFFLAPQLLLHDALLDAKRDVLAGIRAEYDEMAGLARDPGEAPGDLSLRLEVTDRRLEEARSIGTWVYDLPSIGTLAVTSAIPWLTLLRELLSTI